MTLRKIQTLGIERERQRPKSLHLLAALDHPRFPQSDSIDEGDSTSTSTMSQSNSNTSTDEMIDDRNDERNSEMSDAGYVPITPPSCVSADHGTRIMPPTTMYGYNCLGCGEFIENETDHQVCPYRRV